MAEQIKNLNKARAAAPKSKDAIEIAGQEVVSNIIDAQMHVNK